MIQFRARPFRWLCGTGLLFLFHSGPAMGQTVGRQCISSYAPTVNAGAGVYAQTAGQPFGTSGDRQNSPVILQGFQQPPVYITEAGAPIQISMFPNPAGHQLSLNAVSVLDQVSISISDAAGKCVYRENYMEFTSCSIDCSLWNSGLYLIHISRGNESSLTLKLIVSRQ